MGSLLINKRPGSLDIKPASQSKPFQINDFIFLSEGASNSYLIETSEGNINNIKTINKNKKYKKKKFYKKKF